MGVRRRRTAARCTSAASAGASSAADRRASATKSSASSKVPARHHADPVRESRARRSPLLSKIRRPARKHPTSFCK
uniref:Putative secreted protein n=1 Tax=Ixodes ricinus TaxID=34613 RepID=A0A147BQX0_IXORI